MIQNPPYKHRFDPFLVMAYGMGFATWGQLLPTQKKQAADPRSGKPLAAGAAGSFPHLAVGLSKKWGIHQQTMEY